MVKQTIYIGNPAYLKTTDAQMIIIDPESKEPKGRVPIEDIAMVVLDHPQISITQGLIQRLMEHTVAVISCDMQHLPNGLMLPLQGHSELTQRWRNQIDVSLPIKKQLWRQTVWAKINNQKILLEQQGQPVAAMENYLSKINSGDTLNMEGKAANHYWKYFINDFSRDQNENGVNAYLNYGYSILRSIVARALVSTGLLPAMGIFHSNKYNPYCLADDIMEPYRPFVDRRVLDYLKTHPNIDKLNTEAKSHLLKIMTDDVTIEGLRRPLMVAVSTTTASLYKCYIKERTTIAYPLLIVDKNEPTNI